MRGVKAGVKFGGHYFVECHDKDGKLKWRDEIENLVVNVGLQKILDEVFTGAGSPVSPWYLGLTTGSPTPNAADIMSSHGGWTEFTTYSEGTRQAFVETRTGQQVDNASSKATYTISTGGTIGGAFLTSDSAKSGTSGTLMSVGALTGGNRTVVISDTVSLTYTFTAADDGV
jgi:hypothetical protein